MSSYNALLQAASTKYGVPLNLLTAQMNAESSGNPNAVSATGAQGLMQIEPSNDAAYGITDPYDPAQNIDAGAHMDADAYKRMGDWPDALRMYHGGTSRKNWGPKTQAYAEKVMAKSVPSLDQLNSAMGGEAQPTTTPNATAPSFDDLNGAMSAPVPEQPGVIMSTLAGAGKGFGETVLGGQRALGKGLRWLGATDAGNWLVTDADQGVSRLEGQDAPYETAHPTWNQIGSVGGQLVATAPVIGGGARLLSGGLEAGGALLGDTALGNTLSGAGRLVDGTAGAGSTGSPRFLGKTASLVARGAGAGAAFNGLTGANPLSGAAIGAVGAPVGVLGEKAVGAIAQPVARAVGNVITDLSPEWTATAAANKLTKALAQDGLTPDQVAARMRLLGPNATPVDAASSLLGVKAGGNFRNLAETAANSPGEGQALANRVFGQRTESAPERINQAVRAATGATGNVHAEFSDLAAQRAAAARPLYEKALAGTITPDDRLRGFLADPVFQAGLGRGQEIQRLEALASGTPFDASEYASLKTTPAAQTPSLVVGTDGKPLSVTTTPGKTATISMRGADAAKRGLDDLVEGYRDPVTGLLRLDQRGRALNNLRGAYVDYLDQINPDYASARAAWSGPSASMDALNMGRAALNKDAEVTAGNVARLSPNDRQFFLSGVTRALQDKIGAAQDGADATRKIFGNSLIRNRIAAAFDDPEAFDEFARQMGNEAQFAATKNEVLKGSQTARRVAGQTDSGALTLGVGHNVLSGNFGNAAAQGAHALGQFLERPSERQLAAQSRLLFTQNPDEFADAFRRRGAKNALTAGSP